MSLAVWNSGGRWRASVGLKVWSILGVVAATNGLLYLEAVHVGKWADRRREQGLDQVEAISVVIPPGRPPKGSSISLENILRDYQAEHWPLQLRFIPLASGVDIGVPRQAAQSLASPAPLPAGSWARCPLDEAALLAAAGTDAWPGRLMKTLAVADGCWVLLSIAPSTSAAEPAEHMAVVELYCLLATVVAFALAIGVLGRLRAHARLVREMSQRRLPVLASELHCPVRELEGDVRALNQLLTELRRLSDDIRQTAEDDAHDLKAPLGLIKLAHRRLRRTFSGNSAKDLAGLTAAEDAIDRLMASIEAAQALAEEKASLVISSRAPIDLGAAFDGCFRSLEPAIERKRIRVIIDRRDDIVLSTSADLLDMLLSEFLENAVEASPEEGEVVIELGREEGEAVIAVADAGPGISSMSRGTLFARRPLDASASQGHGSRSRSYFTAKRSTDLLGGSIMIDNRGTGGVLAIAYLPL